MSSEGEEDKQRNEAATKIQAAFRGYRTRKKLQRQQRVKYNDPPTFTQGTLNFWSGVNATCMMLPPFGLVAAFAMNAALVVGYVAAAGAYSVALATPGVGQIVGAVSGGIQGIMSCYQHSIANPRVPKTWKTFVKRMGFYTAKTLSSAAGGTLASVVPPPFNIAAVGAFSTIGDKAATYVADKVAPPPSCPQKSWKRHMADVFGSAVPFVGPIAYVDLQNRDLPEGNFYPEVKKARAEAQKTQSQEKTRSQEVKVEKEVERHEEVKKAVPKKTVVAEEVQKGDGERERDESAHLDDARGPKIVKPAEDLSAAEKDGPKVAKPAESVPKAKKDPKVPGATPEVLKEARHVGGKMPRTMTESSDVSSSRRSRAVRKVSAEPGSARRR
ncbi:MAG: hypothetical protein RLN62_05605 [Rickettsiales bacterium]